MVKLYCSVRPSTLNFGTSSDGRNSGSADRRIFHAGTVPGTVVYVYLVLIPRKYFVRHGRQSDLFGGKSGVCGVI